mgnify:CR=1 FL=1
MSGQLILGKHSATNKYVPIAVNSSGELEMTAEISTAGLATEAKQDTINTSVGTVNTSVGTVNTSINTLKTELTDGSAKSKQMCIDRFGGQYQALCDVSGSQFVMERVVYENNTLGSNTLKNYAGNSDLIEMTDHTHLVIQVACSGMTGSLGTLQNLRVQYSLDNSTWVMGETLSSDETPGTAGEYTTFARIERTGFLYVRLFAVGIGGILPASTYTIKYSRS